MTTQFVTKTQLAAILEQAAAALRGSDTPPATEDRESAAPPTPEAPDEDDASPTVTHPPRRPAAPTPGPGGRSWTQVREDAVQPDTRAAVQRTYDSFEVWETSDGRDPDLQFGLGYVAAQPDKEYYGHPRGYWIVHEMVNRRLGTELAVFIEAEQPTDVVAVIRGNGPSGRSMFDPGDDLPAGYENLTVDVFRDRVIGPQAYGKLAVVAVDGDRRAMLNHAAIQRVR